MMKKKISAKKKNQQQQQLHQPTMSEVTEEERTRYEDEEDARDSPSDSSEESEDDEEEIQKVREGFIVDDEEDEVQTKKRKSHKRKRDKERPHHDDALDDDDLELLLENSGLKRGSLSSGKFKRLKRKQIEDDEDEIESQDHQGEQQLRDIFSDDEEVEEEAAPRIMDEFDGFIEEDDFSDEDEQTRLERREQRKKKKQGPRIDTSNLSNVDRQSLLELFEVFGDGNEYDWALEAQELEDAGAIDKEEPASLDEVFEHSELKERMLTEEDNLIRIIDVPERYQMYRSALTYIDLDDEELELEKTWVANTLLKEKKAFLRDDWVEPFKQCVGQVVQFVSKENLEVPFIWNHRRDYLEYVDPDAPIPGSVRELMISEDDVWRIVKLDIEYHSLYEKRLNTEKIIDSLEIDDELVKDIKTLDSMVAIQDMHDYIQFTYSKEIRQREETQNRKHSKFALYERIRENVLYDAVKAYGITAKEFGENVQDQSSKGFEVPYRIHATDDPWESPDDMIERLIQDHDVIFRDEKTARDAVRRTFADEIFYNPKIRHEVRSTYKLYASISVAVTEKGRASIDAHSPFADIKYAINRSPADLIAKPDVLLRMLEAERLGLVVIKVETKDFANWFDCLFNCLKSDGFSDISEKWNQERQAVLRTAISRLCAVVALNTKEDLRRECERLIASKVRRGLLAKIEQAPFTPYGFDIGSKANVLALTFGKGDYDSAVVGVYIKHDGKVSRFFKSTENPSRNRETEDAFKGQLKQFLDEDETPDVVVVSGYNANTKRLHDVVYNFVSEYGISVKSEFDDGSSQLVKVIWGQDETARLYQNSERAKKEFPDKPTLVKYAISLGRYLQDPLLEYITLGDDILSLTFHEHQKLISNDLVKEVVESAFVDLVNAVGVDINESVRDSRLAQTLKYVGGLGPRKASGMLRNIAQKLGSVLTTRSQLIEYELTTRTIFINCSAALKISLNKSINVKDFEIEILDTTRIHPEDYQLAMKMAADALDMDEESELHEKGGVIKELLENDPSKLNLLNLNDFANQIYKLTHKLKFRSLQAIRLELIQGFAEIRSPFRILTNEDAFFILTGEKPQMLKNTVIPATITKVTKNHHDPYARIRGLKVVTPSLIQGTIDENAIPRDAEYVQGQVVQAVVLELYTDTFAAVLSLRREDISRAMKGGVVREYGKWDYKAEDEDIKREKAKENAKLAKTRNIQHPFYRNFNYKQAEEYLAPQNVGDYVIRPSSKGASYLTITWKVGNNLFQHLLVEERSRGRFKEYIVDGKTYEDLDQLAFQHIQVIAKNVTDMVRHPKFREGTLSVVHEWLESYTRANPKSSAYVFCYDHKLPGNFLLLFKVNVSAKVVTWHVKTEVGGYELRSSVYPNMLSLCNGFKQAVKMSLQQTKSYNTGYY